MILLNNVLNSFKTILGSSLFKSISVYTFFRVLNRTIPVLLLPFLTHYLSPSDYGIIDFYLMCLLVFTPFIGLNVSSSVGRLYYDKEEFDYSVYISSIFYFIWFTAIIWLIVVLIFGKQLISFFSLNISLSFLVSLILNCSFDQITLIQLTNWRVKNKPIPYGILGLTRTIVEIVLSILLVKYFLQNWQGRIIGQFVGALVPLILSIIILIKNDLIKRSFNLSYLKKALNFGTPLILHTIGGILIGYSNRFFIYKYLGLESAGIFAAAFQFGLAVSLLQSSFNEAWVPYFFDKLKYFNTLSTKKKVVRITYLYFGVLFILTIILIIIMPYLYKLLGSEYTSGLKISILILIAYYFNGLYKMFANYLFFIKNTQIIAIGTILTLAFNLILNFILIPLLGLSGAAISLLVSFFIQFIIFWTIAQHYFKMPWLIFHSK